MAASMEFLDTGTFSRVQLISNTEGLAMHRRERADRSWQARVSARREKRRGASTHVLKPRGVTGQTMEVLAAGAGKEGKGAHD